MDCDSGDNNIQGWGGSDRRRSDPDLDPIFAGSDRIPIQFCKLGSDRRFSLSRSDPGLAGFFHAICSIFGFGLAFGFKIFLCFKKFVEF